MLPIWTTPHPSIAVWWKSFNDAELDSLVERALRSNPDLRIAEARVREARAQRGSGLGLAIVHSVAERHAGKVWVESVLGQGSTFFLLIPFSSPDASKKKPQHTV